MSRIAIVLVGFCLVEIGCKPRTKPQSASTVLPPSSPMNTYAFPMQTSVKHCLSNCKAELGVIPASTDEQAVGPNSFAIGDDTVVISDPVNKRVVVFQTTVHDTSVAYRGETHLAFPGIIEGLGVTAANVKSIDSDKSLLITNKALGLQESIPALTPQVAVLNGDYQGTAERYFRDGTSAPLSVNIDHAAEHLVSIHSFGTDQDGYTYCLLELANPGKVISIRRVVRKYARDGHLAAEVRGVPDQGDVSPVKEFEVRNSVIYQMVVTATATTINTWDLDKFR